MEIAKTYSPEVQKYRESLLAILEEMRAQVEQKLAHLRTRDAGRIDSRDVRAIMSEYHAAAEPVNAELANLENLANVKFISEPPVWVLPSPPHSS